MSSSTGGKKLKTVKDEVYVYTGQEDVPDNVTHVYDFIQVLLILMMRRLRVALS